jgi:hypothetical protein
MGKEIHRELKKVLTAVDRLYREKVIPDYVLIGGCAAAFYLDVLDTKDVDFIVPAEVPLDRASRLYQRLETDGYSEINNEGYLLIEGWPVHFLPPFNGLHRQMLATASTVSDNGFECKVARPEYLAADSMRMNRPEKDFNRVFGLRNLPGFNEELFVKLVAPPAAP